MDSALRLHPLELKKRGPAVQPPNQMGLTARASPRHAVQPDSIASGKPLSHSQQQMDSSSEAQPPVVAFATLVAQVLLHHISKVIPAEASYNLAEQLKQQIDRSAAEAAAAGRSFSMTAALEQLLPELGKLAASVTQHGLPAAAAGAGGSTTGGVGQWTQFEFTGSHPFLQQQQQQQPLLAGAAGSPLSGQHSSAHLSTALLSMHNSHLGRSAAGTCPAAAPAAAAAVSPSQLMQPTSGLQDWDSMSLCSECDSNSD